MYYERAAISNSPLTLEEAKQLAGSVIYPARLGDQAEIYIKKLQKRLDTPVQPEQYKPDFEHIASSNVKYVGRRMCSYSINKSLPYKLTGIKDFARLTPEQAEAISAQGVYLQDSFFQSPGVNALDEDDLQFYRDCYCSIWNLERKLKGFEGVLKGTHATDLSDVEVHAAIDRTREAIADLKAKHQRIQEFIESYEASAN
jgi:hypothetical protein